MKRGEKILLRRLLSNYIQDKTALNECVREIVKKFDFTISEKHYIDVETIVVKRGDRSE